MRITVIEVAVALKHAAGLKAGDEVERVSIKGKGAWDGTGIITKVVSFNEYKPGRTT